MKPHRITLVALGLLAAAGLAGAPDGGVSLSIISSWAQRSDSFVIHTESGDITTNHVAISCTAVLNNQTPASLTVTSSFFSAFDGLYVTVFDETGKQLARQSYCYHQSPYSLRGRAFTVPVGPTTNELRFPIFGISESNKTLRVRLDGTLPRSTYSGSVTSDIVAVTIEKWKTR